MRLHRIRTELTSIRRQLRAGKRQVCQEELQRYAADGTPPEDPLTAAYVELNQAALAAMEASVSGADHEAAVEAYRAALAGWQRASRGA